MTAGSVTANIDMIKGVVMTGPALSDLLPNIARTMPTVFVPGQSASLDGLTRDQEKIRKFTSDPLVPQRKIPFLIAATTLNAMQQVNNDLTKWEIPTLVIYGSAATYMEWNRREKFLDGIVSEDKWFRRYEDRRH